jgi:transcriptional regulator of heat shock response
MNERQEQLLKIIVESYVQNAEPIGSSFVVENYDLEVSPATVRNDMVVLESDGYIHQPHVSAGRVPTEKGYKRYLEKFLDSKTQTNVRKKLERAVDCEADEEDAIRSLAKKLVDLSGEAVVMSFGSNVHYSGLSNLFCKPDFQNEELLKTISEYVDQFDEVLKELEKALEDEPRVFVGRGNPFGSGMSSVVLKYRLPSANGVIGFVGPMRMDYSKNVRLLEIAGEIIKNL